MQSMKRSSFIAELRRIFAYFQQIGTPTLSDDIQILTAPESLPSYQQIADLMKQFTVDNLVATDPSTFKEKIDHYLGLDDSDMEGYTGESYQRDLSVKFHWGHNHDFGSFQLKGRMKNRHIEILTLFCDQFGVPLESFRGLRILDIGAWTGGFSLLLSALGAKVTALEEVKKYTDVLEFLRDSFGLEDFHVYNMSLFELDNEKFYDQFDVVLYSGVLYHVTDPILSLRILFNVLRDNGICLTESLTIAKNEPILEYSGAQMFSSGEQPNKNRQGWNWLIPSPTTVKSMLYDVGFSDVEIGIRMDKKRVLAVARRIKHVDMLRAGLARPNIR